MDFELSSEFSIIQAIPHFTIFAKKSESTRLWFQETLGTKRSTTVWVSNFRANFREHKLYLTLPFSVDFL